MTIVKNSCFGCKFRKLPLIDNACEKGVTDEHGWVINCLGWEPATKENKGNEEDK